MAGRKPAEATVTTMELAWCRLLWDNFVTKKGIRRKLKWGWRKLDKILEFYNFPKRPPGAARHEYPVVEEYVIKYATHPINEDGMTHLQRYIDYYDLKNMERIRRNEFTRAMITTELMNSVVLGILNIIGTNSDQIKSFTGHKELSKKMDIIYKVHRILLKILDHRCRLVGLFSDKKTKIRGFGGNQLRMDHNTPWDDASYDWYDEELEKAIRLLDPERNVSKH